MSIIIPTLNDIGCIDRAIADARGVGDVQIIVVDGGSRDGTAMRPTQQGVRTMSAGRERGRSLKAAAAAASGDVIVVVPPDLSLPLNALSELSLVFRTPDVLAGVFIAQFERHSWLWGSIYRMLRFAGLLPHGSAWFFWRTAAEGDTSPRPLRVFEDLDLLSRIARQGKLVTVASPATIHPGAELHRLFWTLMRIPYAMGLSPRILGCLYRKPKARRQQAALAAGEIFEQDSRTAMT